MHSDGKKISAFSVNHILQAAENTMSSEEENERKKNASAAVETPEEYSVKMNLEEDDLWRRFKVLTNEMIVTKSGR